VSGRLWETELAAFDVETTGLSPRAGHRVIEIAVARGRAGERPRVWSTLLHPGRAVSATWVHGITDAMVADQPLFASIVDEMRAQFEGALPVAHNAPFDLAFIGAELERCDAGAPPRPVLDTLAIARRCFALPSNSLGALCEHFGVVNKHAHRAGDDAAATLDLAWRMIDALDPEKAMTVEDALSLSRPRSVEEQRAIQTRLLAAQSSSTPIVIDYHAGDKPGAGRTRRTITVHKVTSTRVEAWCHLREAERVFRIDRIRLP